MSDAGSDPLNFREIDAGGNPARYGRADGVPGPGTYGPGSPAGDAAGSLPPPGLEGSGQAARLSINPFIAALWAVAAGLILSAFGAFTVAQEMLNTPGTADSTPTGYMWMTFAPFLLFAGLLGIMGLLFWHAGQWRRNRERQQAPS
ncbi:MAG: hypothetical protein M3127_04920 [Actinomycetota bacterium]|nr:hypothetical protein [Actinomycetota bacterium]